MRDSSLATPAIFIIDFIYVSTASVPQQRSDRRDVIHATALASICIVIAGHSMHAAHRERLRCRAQMEEARKRTMDSDAARAAELKARSAPARPANGTHPEDDSVSSTSGASTERSQQSAGPAVHGRPDSHGEPALPYRISKPCQQLLLSTACLKLPNHSPASSRVCASM